MRSETEMMNLILSTARKDERVRAVILNGSRANANVKKDICQDYDIVYLVRGIDSFTRDHSWVDVFGERIMMQLPEEKVLPPADGLGRFPYLMQFMDGNRIDLTLIPVEKMDELLLPDSLSVLLLDKDGLMGPMPPASDRDYWVQKPTAQEFADICNEFWWISMNISKGLWRRELTYAMFMHEQINRHMLMKMLEWKVGIQTDFTKSAGKVGKDLPDFLDQGEWEQFEATYSDAKFHNIWNALFAMCDLFRKNAIEVADKLGFAYHYEDDKRVTAFLKHVRNLPADADSIY
ncbi:aminoglycoside 6-adenylyltransferase [Bacillus sp. ISL-47]|uniref:aminoglycoside 6-adenylyltransferase n=1 Tax=Bacillus sp. ISL-47 TaxID=2819130 RepID=UPI001BE89237|nr:aminoglycoside 6-adenylyltransferase [Bacillus sp. ISL-47]MBT2690163.1 aminoglycoside 6-adenylyltransferase [Bacillus sp. ISL-47]MBT2710388.1 aminoglycoside 6-adenylyltransferase [Pseudomonas sp. ISL-84]